MKLLEAIRKFFGVGNDATVASVPGDDSKQSALFDLIAKDCDESLIVCIKRGSDIKLFVKMDKNKSVLTSVLPKIANDVSLMSPCPR